ncbi:FG-GAP-like repeat-containing protein [Flavobacteriaceae bacterium SZ-1-7]|uniref:FG-GAP-like repeat-containing protein n=1 Tax=Tamlana sedimenti TaxID=3134126 RepID=UPI0031271503
MSTLEENNGVAIADFDLDGDLDMFVVAKAQDLEGFTISHSKLFSNNNDGTFTDVTEVSGLVNLFPVGETGEESVALTGFKFGAFWGDYDNDGYPDLFMTHTNKMQLFHNESNGSFKEVTIEAGFKKYNDCINTDATWFDFNKDGFLDIYISDWDSDCEGNRLYKNNGDGTFSDVSNIFDGPLSKLSYQSIPFDFNGDGWLDLYVANDGSSQTSDLFINQEGTGFVEQANTYGLLHSADDMGMAIGDYNNDGFFDLYITAIERNALFTNNGDYTFQNLAPTLQVERTGWSWDVAFHDFDLDRDEDLFVVNGFKVRVEKNEYFENLSSTNQISFVNRSSTIGLGEETISVGAGVFDFDNDGDLDIYVSNNDRPSYFYENDITDQSRESDNINWFKIKLEGTISNRDAIGSTLSVKTSSGSLHRYYSGKGFLSQNLVPVHFGLGADNVVSEFKITWPSGLSETYTNISANTTILAKEGQGYQVLDVQPSVKLYGCMDPSSCTYNPNAVIGTDACVYPETGKIEGKKEAQKNSVETYSYSLDDNSVLNWQVTGGEILERQPNSITVNWGTENEGRITLSVTNKICSSEIIALVVSLLDGGTVNLDGHSVARLWNETLLSLIRKDYARPTVHARNLFHTGVAMYDAWAIYDEKASPYLIGNQVQGFKSNFDGFSTIEPIIEARDKTISYSAYRLLTERFKHSPNPTLSQAILDAVMEGLGYDISIKDEDYGTGSSIALGNYIASQVIEYGLQDGSNEQNEYANIFYEPVNEPLNLSQPDQSQMESIDPERWQPLSFNTFIDQSGNVIGGVTPDFLSPEWGNVQPFSLVEGEKTTHIRDGHDYRVYHDPGAPPSVTSQDYKWTFTMVSRWSSHLDPYDGVKWDISPKSIGNISSNQFPQKFSDYKDFYKEAEGGDIGAGYTMNPVTKQPYQEQIVPRGDYTRVLAEFWADGPDSETPPGHWFTILNYINDHELLKKRFNGQGNILFDLEWDIKAYFILGGAMHDSAIASWGVKGFYDYIRPISAIRYMCAKGQCTDASKPNYNTLGIHLIPGLVELVEEGDPLGGKSNENIGKIKLYSWKGHDYIDDPAVDEAGVGWILAENWWPYQRPTFVTPPFAGYVSGHSTYSRAAAEVLTLLTGDAYFPGGMGEFFAKKNEFLVFEEGPSVDVTLQWATYRDASDQCSLSRIWGGIHPPADDINGRIIGEKIGKEAFEFGARYFEGFTDGTTPISVMDMRVYPNPVSVTTMQVYITGTALDDLVYLFDINGRLLEVPNREYDEATGVLRITLSRSLATGIYVLKVNDRSRKIVVVRE